MIVLAPSYMHQDIYRYYRKDNPLFDVKVIDKNEFIEAGYPNVKKSAILYLMNNFNYSYDYSETLLKYIPFVTCDNTNKFKQLLELKEELKKQNILYENEPLKYLYSSKEVVVIGYNKEDEELKHLASSLDIKLDFFKLEKVNNQIEAYQFVRFEDEVTYVLNEVAHLLDSGVDISDILLVRRNKEYDYYLNRFAPLFGYQINLDMSSSWLETGIYVEFINIYENNKDIISSLEELKEIAKEDELYDEFSKVVSRYYEEDLSYEVQRSYLLHNLANINVKTDKYYPAIKVVSNLSLINNKHVFILGFTQGDFPKTSKDSDYLSEKELKSLHLLTAKEETKFDQENILDLLALDNHYVLTYANKTLQEKKCYPSPIISLLGLKPIENPFKEYFYSKEALSYIYSDLCDLAKYYDERPIKYHQIREVIDIPYDEYSNAYTFTNVNNESTSLLLSCSQLNDYFGCPYKYYLSRVISVDPFEENEATILGNIVHKLLELGLLDETYDVESHLIKMIDESNTDEETKILWKFSLKDQIIEMVKYLRKHPRYMKNPAFEFEKVLYSKLDPLTTLTGRIDKLVILDNKYVTAVDYKTGSSGDFNPKDLDNGQSTQLPTYAYLFQTNSKYSSYIVSGLYINHLINTKNDMSVSEDALIPAHLRLSGKSLASLEAVSAFDNTIAVGKSEFIKGVSLDKTGQLKINKTTTSLVSENELQEYVDKTKEKYLEAASKIRNNQFEIHPLKDKEVECKYCKYKDICYVRGYQFNEVSKSEEGENEKI